MTGRPLTPQEKKWLVDALSALERGEQFGGGVLVEEKSGDAKPVDVPVDPLAFLKQVDSLVVTSRCDCADPNCHTVYFQFYRGFHSGAIAFHFSEDGHTVIVHADDETSKIDELEVI